MSWIVGKSGTRKSWLKIEIAGRRVNWSQSTTTTNFVMTCLRSLSHLRSSSLQKLTTRWEKKVVSSAFDLYDVTHFQNTKMRGNLLVIDKKIRTVRKDLSPSPIINIDVKKLQSWKSKHQQLKQNSIKTKSKGKLIVTRLSQSTSLDLELDNVRFLNYYLLFKICVLSLSTLANLCSNLLKGCWKEQLGIKALFITIHRSTVRTRLMFPATTFSLKWNVQRYLDILTESGANTK